MRLNDYQQKLWDDLMALTESSEAFYYKDFDLGFGEAVYRIFNYRLAAYTEFLQPSALECRGIMFEITHEGKDAKPLRLAAFPMSKFFNLDENPMTMNLDLSKIEEITLKADGSLISTYIHYYSEPEGARRALRLKTKGSLNSDQSIAATQFLYEFENEKFRNELRDLTLKGYTVNMEWCAPDNRVVIGYMEPRLTVLDVRNTENGEYVTWEQLALGDLGRKYPQIVHRWIEQIDVNEDFLTREEFVRDIPEMEGVEGYVVQLEDGMRIKIKTLWYLTQHRAKDAINSPRRLYEAVLAEATDDLRTLFHDDPLVIQRIEEMEQRVEGIYNPFVDHVERYFERNKHLDRKDYAIKGQEELTRLEFSVAMSKYIGREVNYKEFLMGKWKAFGIKDDPIDEEETQEEVYQPPRERKASKKEMRKFILGK